MYALTERILEVDLRTEELKVNNIPESIYRECLNIYFLSEFYTFFGGLSGTNK